MTFLKFTNDHKLLNLLLGLNINEYLINMVGVIKIVKLLLKPNNLGKIFLSSVNKDLSLYVLYVEEIII